MNGFWNLGRFFLYYLLNFYWKFWLFFKDGCSIKGRDCFALWGEGLFDGFYFIFLVFFDVEVVCRSLVPYLFRFLFSDSSRFCLERFRVGFILFGRSFDILFIHWYWLRLLLLAVLNLGDWRDVWSLFAFLW